MIDKSFDNLLNSSEEDDDLDLSEVLGDEVESCAMADMIMSLSLMPKPFGMTWSNKQMTDFLKARGYKILTRFDEDTDDEYDVAVKKDADCIPENCNIISTFAEEIQTILLKWLLKISKECDGSK